MTLAEQGGWPTLLGRLVAGDDLERDEAAAGLTEILRGDATGAQIAAFIVALRQKGESVDEIAGLVDAMLDAAEPLDVPPQAIDIVGVGGAPTRRDAALNVSTMASIVAAGAGTIVCKHGNRKASSTSGSFDLLEALGVAIDLTPDQLERCVVEVGLGFAFARTFHPAMRYAAPVRAELGIPTVFNVLGPLSHPGRVRRQVIGVAEPEMAAKVLDVLDARDAERAMVVHGAGGLDELALTGPSTVHELRDGQRAVYELDPTALGFSLVDPGALAGGDASANAAILGRILDGEAGPHRDIVVLNAGAGVLVGGGADTIADGVEAAAAAIDDGSAAAKLRLLVETTARLVG